MFLMSEVPLQRIPECCGRIRVVVQGYLAHKKASPPPRTVTGPYTVTVVQRSKSVFCCEISLAPAADIRWMRAWDQCIGRMYARNCSCFVLRRTICVREPAGPLQHLISGSESGVGVTGMIMRSELCFVLGFVTNPQPQTVCGWGSGFFFFASGHEVIIWSGVMEGRPERVPGQTVFPGVEKTVDGRIRIFTTHVDSKFPMLRTKIDQL